MKNKALNKSKSLIPTFLFAVLVIVMLAGGMFLLHPTKMTDFTNKPSDEFYKWAESNNYNYIETYYVPCEVKGTVLNQNIKEGKLVNKLTFFRVEIGY